MIQRAAARMAGCASPSCDYCAASGRIMLREIPLEALLRVVEAARHVSYAGLEFSDPRVSYESWQIDRGEMQALQAALAALDAAMEERG